MDYAQFEGHTPGPWAWCGTTLDQTENPYKEVIGNDVSCGMYCLGGSWSPSIPDADRALIAAAPDLLAETAQLRAEVERLKAALEALTEHSANVNTAFYVIGTSKAMKAAMGGQKALLDAARAALGKGAA